LPDDPNIAAFFECSCEPFNFPINNGILPCTPYNEEEIKTWVYPSSKDFRKYQFRICRTALFNNTLVCLPTGLGKTFIATVIMHNYYRWFLKGLVFFLAPTKPLVDQQYNAFSEIVKNVPHNVISQLTGKSGKAQRQREYCTSRIFFMTPQTLANDLEAGIIQEKNITCIVFDEAHKATGNYAYCRIIKHLEITGIGYRIVGLSATPGSDEEQVQELIRNLAISKIEARDENDPDVKPYTHNKNIQELHIKNTECVIKLEKLIKEVIDIPKRFLEEHNLLPRQKWMHNKLQILEWQEKFQERFAKVSEQYGEDFVFLAFTSFSCMLSLVTSHQMLLTHGVATFKENILKFKDSVNEKRGRLIIIQSQAFQDLINILTEIDSPEIHPKLIKTKEVLYEYYSDPANAKSQTIIFTMFVASARQIAKFFKEDKFVNAALFVGQANGITQKQQIEIISDFKNHVYNTLIATCIGEEGLDIGQVNLIICYDFTGSPVRMIQRFGRTGRKQDGKIVIMLAEEEERKYNIAKKKSHELFKILKSQSESAKNEHDPNRDRQNKYKKKVNDTYKFVFYGFNPRMIKEEIKPKPVYLTQQNEIQYNGESKPNLISKLDVPFHNKNDTTKKERKTLEYYACKSPEMLLKQAENEKISGQSLTIKAKSLENPYETQIEKSLFDCEILHDLSELFEESQNYEKISENFDDIFSDTENTESKEDLTTLFSDLDSENHNTFPMKTKFDYQNSQIISPYKKFKSDIN